MNLVKCPRCDLNYIREDEKYCKVCLRELKGENSQDEVELCSICNEEPALPGKDICLFCLKEMNKSNSTPDDESENVDFEPLSSFNLLSTSLSGILTRIVFPSKSFPFSSGISINLDTE